MATHSSILACRISWTEKPGWLQAIGSQKDTTEWLTHTHTQQDIMAKINVVGITVFLSTRSWLQEYLPLCCDEVLTFPPTP